MTATPAAIAPSRPSESMRDRFVALVTDLMEEDPRLFAILAEVSSSAFGPVIARHPLRALSAGIMEQTVVSAAAGVAMEGFIPVVHSIAPFIVHRPLEQIRDDFVLQRLGLNIVSIGASYDYAEDGYTHHAPDDVPALRALAGVRVVVPGTPAELERLFRSMYADGLVTYFRLSAARNREDRPVAAGRLEVISHSPGAAVVVAVGPMLDRVIDAVEGLDVSLAYCTTVSPFDAPALRDLAGSRPRVVLVEPYHAGGLVADVVAAVAPLAVRIEAVGVPHEVTRGYGTAADHDEAFGLTTPGIRRRLEAFLAADPLEV
jgi:transketolase